MEKKLIWFGLFMIVAVFVAGLQIGHHVAGRPKCYEKIQLMVPQGTGSGNWKIQDFYTTIPCEVVQ